MGITGRLDNGAGGSGASGRHDGDGSVAGSRTRSEGGSRVD